MQSHAWRHIVAIAAALALGSACLAGELPQQTLSGYTMRVWQTTDGLPEQTVQSFAQTSDGFLWIGTTGGLLQFDGARFRLFNRDSDPAFTENSVFALTATADGNLWIGTDGGGLIRYRNGVFHHYGPTEGLTCGFVRVVKVDTRGVVWIGTDNGLFQLPDAQAPRALRVDTAGNVPDSAIPLAVHGLAEDDRGRMWVGGSRLLRFGQTVDEVKLPGKYGENRVKSIVQTSDGSIWVGTVSGLLRMTTAEREFQHVSGIAGTVRVLLQMPDGRLWIGTIGQGAYTYEEGVLQRVTPPNPLPSQTILGLFEDSDGNLWMGTQAGMLRFSRTNARLISLPEAADSDFETISRDSDGTLWIASTHLYHLLHGKAIPYEFPELHGAHVRNVFRDRQNSLWIGTDGRGIFHITPKGTTQYTTAKGLVNNFVRAILQTSDGAIWVGTDEGISRIGEGRIRNLQVDDGLAYFSIRAFAQDSAGDLWIGTDHGLSHLRLGSPADGGHDQFVQDEATRTLRNEKIFAVMAGKDGDMWFGTSEGGLFLLRPQNGESSGNRLTRFTTRDGLVSDNIYSIVEDGWGQLWIGSPNGISRIMVRELEQHSANPSRPITQMFFSRADAGPIAGLYGGTQPAAAITPDGEVWFPTVRGPVHIATNEQKVNSADPKVFVDHILADGKTVPAGEAAVLKAANVSVEIAYAPLQLKSQDDLRFMYKLEGFDRDWQYVSTRRTAYYTNLPAGHYRFRVRAFPSQSPDEGSEASLVIVKNQYFYRTWWFLGSCFFALALIAWLSYRIHVRRMHQEFQAVMNERARLAREMHDTLIQGCTSISAILEACSGPDEREREEQLELIDYARIQLATAIDEARQAVWDLRLEKSSDLTDALKRLAETTGHDSGVAVQCVVEGEPYPFRPQAVHELMMVSREALFNALMHANPSRVILRAVYGEEILTLAIHDDGCGFNADDVSNGHFGLVGIQERVRQLGGEVKISSMHRQGTQILVHLPRQRVIYEETKA